MDTQTTKETLQKMLDLMGLDATVEDRYDDSINMSVLAIEVKEANTLIGHGGEHLSALSHVVKKIADRVKSDEKNSFIVDINGYQTKRIQGIKDKAVILAQRAKYFKSSVEMDPMSPYERMIAHSILSNDSELETRSHGQGRQRRIVIQYKGE